MKRYTLKEVATSINKTINSSRKGWKYDNAVLNRKANVLHLGDGLVKDYDDKGRKVCMLTKEAISEILHELVVKPSAGYRRLTHSDIPNIMETFSDSKIITVISQQESTKTPVVVLQVINNNEVPMTSSRRVAEYFEKDHRYVTASVESLINNLDNLVINSNDGNNRYAESCSMFFETSYSDSYGRSQKEYIMTRDGFTLLVMGFNNTNSVLKWKLDYMQKFNEMEEQLRQGQANLTIALDKKIEEAIERKMQSMAYKTHTAILQLDKKVNEIKGMSEDSIKRMCLEINKTSTNISELQNKFTEITTKLESKPRIPKELYRAKLVKHVKQFAEANNYNEADIWNAIYTQFKINTGIDLFAIAKADGNRCSIIEYAEKMEINAGINCISLLHNMITEFVPAE